jgi:uncharacterized membrane-anchored protein YjiN (DUF445 family)
MKSDAQNELDLPVLDEVVDPKSERAKLVNALDELSSLIERVPRPGQSLSDEAYAKLHAELNERLIEMFDEMAERMKYIIPRMVDETLREHLDKKKKK